MSALADLTTRLEKSPIRTARVSSTRTGSCCPYPYWDAVRYQVRLSGRGYPTNVALARAGFGRRSIRLAEQDCDAICEREGRIKLPRIGRLTEQDASYILSQLQEQADAQVYRS